MLVIMMITLSISFKDKTEYSEINNNILSFHLVTGWANEFSPCSLSQYFYLEASS